jgi:hypothetical protein
MSPLGALSAVALPLTATRRSCSQGWRGICRDVSAEMAVALAGIGGPPLLGNECASKLTALSRVILPLLVDAAGIFIM